MLQAGYWRCLWSLDVSKPRYQVCPEGLSNIMPCILDESNVILYLTLVFRHPYFPVHWLVANFLLCNILFPSYLSYLRRIWKRAREGGRYH